MKKEQMMEALAKLEEAVASLKSMMAMGDMMEGQMEDESEEMDEVKPMPMAGGADKKAMVLAAMKKKQGMY